jgi:hypothetical protein
MNEALKRKQQLRFAFLNKIYKLANGNTDEIVNGGEVAHQIGLKNGEEDQAREAANYLEGEGLISVQRVVGSFPGYVRLTHVGLREIENAIRQPDIPTDHFMPINILNVGQMIGSTIQQGSMGSSQTLNISSDGLEQIQVFIDQLLDSMDKLQLPLDLGHEIIADVSTVKAQLTSPKPKTSILREGLGSIKRILEGAVGSAIGAQLASQIPALLAML